MDNVQIVRDMLRAVEERDGDRLLQLFHPEVEFRWPDELPGYGGEHKGAEEVDAMGAIFSALWDPRQPTADWRRLHAQIVAVDGNSVVVRYHQRGVNSAGRTGGSEVLAHYELDGQRVRRLEMFYRDPSAVRAFLNDPA